MKYSYNWLKDYVKKIPSPDKLADILTFGAFEVEGITKLGSDRVFDIDVLPNRMPDASGHIGVAREIHALTKTEFKEPRVTIKKSGKDIKKILKVSVSSEGTDRYIASYLDGIKIKPSAKIIRERLMACGLRPINNIVDITNYVLLETGHPVHAFDYDKLEGKILRVRFAKAGERMETIDGAVINLAGDDLVIADAKGPIALAGIKGGRRAEIGSDTERVVFETAVFDKTRVRKTSRRVGVSTDASARFSHGLPSGGLDLVARRLLSLAQKAAGGSAAKEMIDIIKNKARLSSIVLNAEYVSGLLGSGITENEIKSILARLGCAVSRKKKGIFLVTVPVWRLDLETQEDLIEEIGRVRGYGVIDAAPPIVTLSHAEDNGEHLISDRLRSDLSAAGFFEVQNYALESEREHKFSQGSARAIEIENPVSEHYAFMRGSLAGGLLKNIKKNSDKAGLLKFFEIGKVFSGSNGKITEESVVSFALSGNAGGSELYFEAKGILETLMARFGVGKLWFGGSVDKVIRWPYSREGIMHPHRKAFIHAGGDALGIMYQVHPTIAASNGINGPVVIVEIAMKEFVNSVRHIYGYKPISKYPAITRDVSILVPRDVRVEQVMSVIEITGGKLLVDTDLFDFFEGAELGDGSKSLAFHLVFQSDSKTLTDADANDLFARIERALKAQGWEVRQ